MISAVEASQIRQIWQDVSIYPCHQADQAMLEFMERFRHMVNAHSVLWLGSVTQKDFTGVPTMEILDNWSVIDLIPTGQKDGQMDPPNRYELFMKVKQKYGIDPITAAALENAGTTRACIRRDSMDDEEWAQHWITREFHSETGDYDVMHVIYSVDENCESYLIFHQGHDQPGFTEKDKELAFTASSGIASLHRQMMSLRGATLPNKRLLSPQEKTVLSHLLQGMKEKEIAHELAISPATAHKHIISIYRKFDVSGKFDLIARFL